MRWTWTPGIKDIFLAGETLAFGEGDLGEVAMRGLIPSIRAGVDGSGGVAWPLASEAFLITDLTHSLIPLSYLQAFIDLIAAGAQMRCILLGAALAHQACTRLRHDCRFVQA